MAQVEGQLRQHEPNRDGVELSSPVPVDDPAIDNGLIEDLLVEEVSIDGMCGVY